MRFQFASHPEHCAHLSHRFMTRQQDGLDLAERHQQVAPASMVDDLHRHQDRSKGISKQRHPTHFLTSALRPHQNRLKDTKVKWHPALFLPGDLRHHQDRSKATTTQQRPSRPIEAKAL
jgi:hypothetical protein